MSVYIPGGQSAVRFGMPAEIHFANVVIHSCALYGADIATALKIAALGIEAARAEKKKPQAQPEHGK